MSEMPAAEYERVPELIRTFTAIDLDRVLFKTNDFYEKVMLPNIARDTQVRSGNPQLAELMIEIARQEELANRGQAFDFCAFIQSQWHQYGLGTYDYDDLARRLVSGDDVASERPLLGEDILADDALELLKAIEAEPDSQWGILTTGGDATQTLKLSLTGHVVASQIGTMPRAMIVHTENKAEEVARQWYSKKTGLYTVPEVFSDGKLLASRSVRVIDDKRRNLTFPDGLVSEGSLMTVLAARPIGNNDSEPGAIALGDIAKDLRTAA